MTAPPARPWSPVIGTGSCSSLADSLENGLKQGQEQPGPLAQPRGSLCFSGRESSSAQSQVPGKEVAAGEPHLP